MIDIEKDIYFIKSFWEWFDTLSEPDKKRFWYFPHDFAKLYYYNKIYRHLERL